MVSSWDFLQFHPRFYDFVEQIPAWKCKNPVLEIKFFSVFVSATPILTAPPSLASFCISQ